MKTSLIICYTIALTIFCGCDKNFLDAKPSTNIIIPKSLDDIKGLLDNNTLNFTSGLGQMGSDEYVFLDYLSWQNTFTATERNSYIWAADLYEGENQIDDWNRPYTSIFYANNILKELEKISQKPLTEYNQLKGWALFIRAFSYYDLVRTFAQSFDPASASSDLGLPLRLNPEIDVMAPRSSVQKTYDQIINDLKQSCNLLTVQFQQANRNRPSKGTAYALLSRIYLSMNKYDQAKLYADSSLALYDKLIDYNTISTTNVAPFTLTNDETLFSSTQVSYNITINNTSNTWVTISPDLIRSYSPNDLRLVIYFAKNSIGNYYVKRGYYGAGSFPFTGLATDELYLIKAECLARRDQPIEAMNLLNTLLKLRYKNSLPYVPLTATNTNEAIKIILLERQKELIWRGLRWSDIKRLNKIGAEITLKRVLNDTEYTLKPNDQRYAMPIPDDEITRSKINQNPR